MPSRKRHLKSVEPGTPVVVHAIYSECAPTLSPGPAVVLGVEGVTPEGEPVTVQIFFPASGVQSLRKDLRVAHTALPLELRQENN